MSFAPMTPPFDERLPVHLRNKAEHLWKCEATASRGHDRRGVLWQQIYSAFRRIVRMLGKSTPLQIARAASISLAIEGPPASAGATPSPGTDPCRSDTPARTGPRP